MPMQAPARRLPTAPPPPKKLVDVSEDSVPETPMEQGVVSGDETDPGFLMTPSGQTTPPAEEKGGETISPATASRIASVAKDLPPHILAELRKAGLR